VSVVLGTQFYAGPRDAMRRQQQALDALGRLRGVIPINVQWVDEVHERTGVETIATLTQDSRTVTGLPAGRKPIMPELFDALASVAVARGVRYFGFFNADIVILQAAIDAVLRGGKEAYAFSRMDVDPESGREVGLVPNGLDLFVFSVEFWRRERARFRPYILGEWFYDCVFGALIVCHGHGEILNREGEIRHEAHPHAPQGGLSVYNGYLAALDAEYFSMWVRYRARLDALRARGASADEQLALQREVFVRRRSVASAVVQAGRSAKAFLHYRRKRAQLARTMIVTTRDATGKESSHNT
jgi:hypothetical protein